jgi:hypothetical protein
MVECARKVRAIARAGLSQDELDSLKSICERIRANLGNSGEGAEVPASCAAAVEASDVE